MNTILSQLPNLSPGDLERWVAAAVVVGGALLLWRKLEPRRPNGMEGKFVTKEEFREFRAAVEHDLGGLRDRIDTRHLGIIERLDELKASLLGRISQLEEGIARVDERTKKSS